MTDHDDGETASAEKLAALRRILSLMERVAVAVSGGVDSLTLARVAADTPGVGAAMYHATSPAVPPEATRRVVALAARFGWSLTIFDAGEFADADYRANPANRCFYCKTNLYGALARQTSDQILSGTNLDDLGEYRPGLEAARDHRVRHPFVEAGIDKATVRRIAAALDLGEIADLPAAPCLASRIETGIAIDPVALGMIDAAEMWLRRALRPRTVRCRIRAAMMVVELDQATLATIDGTTERRLRAALSERASAVGIDLPVSFAPYRAGSAFLVDRA